MSNYLVTGFRGYIGSVLCKMLKEHGHTVYGYDTRYSLVHSKYVDYVAGGFWQLPFATELDGIFYLGSHSLLNESLSQPLKFYHNNVGTLIKDLCELNNNEYDKGFVFASSAAVYGNATKIVGEDAEKHPLNPYGQTKLMGEKIISEAQKVGKFSYFNMRFFNVAGAYDDVGQHSSQPHLLTALCRYASDTAKNKKFTHYGSNIRDFIHVKDVCFALMAAMDELNMVPYKEDEPNPNTSIEMIKVTEKNDTSNWASSHNIYTDDRMIYPNSNESLNICTGVGTSTYDFIKAFAKCTGTQMDILQDKQRAGDPRFLVGNNEKAKRILNWNPYYSSLGEIIESAWKYYTNNGE